MQVQLLHWSAVKDEAFVEILVGICRIPGGTCVESPIISDSNKTTEREKSIGTERV